MGCSARQLLVTGGAGFIGSYLIDQLMAWGDDVVCLDNVYTGSKRNILKWLNPPRFELICHDITEAIRLEVDRIYHLACPSSPIHYLYNLVKTIKTNVMSTLTLMRLMERDWLGLVNLGHPTEYTILELANLIRTMVNPDAGIQYQPLDEPRRRRPDITLARTRLGWTPTIELQASLHCLVDDFRERLGTLKSLATPP